MQTAIQVIPKRGYASLRDKILKDTAGLERFNLYVEREKTPGRTGGWGKLKDTEYPGAINIHWDKDAKVLMCRVVNRGRARPDDTVGDFVAYLLSRQGRHIRHLSLWAIN